jgi:peptidoglycan/LPS O-acetylase OafA/YrhL
VLLALHVDLRQEIWTRYVDSMTLSPFGPWVDGVYWTLGIEIVFYALILGLIAANGFRKLIVFCYVIGAMSAAYWLIGAIAFPSFQLAHLWDRLLQLSLIEHGVYFALGMLVYCVTVGERLSRHAAFVAVLLPAAAVEIHTKALDNNLTFQSSESDFVPITIFLLAFVAILASLRWRANEATARRLRVAGLATYPLYLIHDVIGSAVIRLSAGFGFNRYPALVVAVTLCIGASWLVAAVLEQPLRRLLGAAFDRALQAQRMAGGNAAGSLRNNLRQLLLRPNSFERP